MPGDSVTLRLEGEVTMDKLADALTKFTAVLNRLDQDRGAHITWVVSELSHGSALATAHAVPDDEASIHLVPTVCDDFLEAARQVSRGDGVSRPILRLVSNLTSVANATNRVILETADDELIFNAPLNALAASPTGTTKALGSVRGRVETLSHRKELRFTLYELASDRAVSCYLKPGNEELMRDAGAGLQTSPVSSPATRKADGRSRYGK